VRVEGRAAHAGADPERGVSAVHELCRQVPDISALANPAASTTVNVGVIRGGSRPNVVAAEAGVDFRAATSAEMDRIVAAMSALRPHVEGAVLRVTGGVNRPPMERTAASEQLYRLARGLALGLAFELRAEGTGGASDGNFTAHLGVPTLDGLGAVGNGGHSLDEYMVLDELPRCTALLVRLLGREWYGRFRRPASHVHPMR
jgi:glutamate carboxypeptidase